MAYFKAVTKTEGQGNSEAIDVSSYGEHPYSSLSPFAFSETFEIPVPGQNGALAHSVEAIWQGLKVIGGEIDPTLFLRNPHKRKGAVEGHRLNGKTIDVIAAREKIFRPSYMFFVEHYIPEELKQSIAERALHNPVTFYDVEENVDPADPTSSLAHAVYTRDFFEIYLDSQLARQGHALDDCYTRSKLPHETLAEPLARALHYFEDASPFEKKLIAESLSQSKGKDKFHARFLKDLKERVQAERVKTTSP